MPWYERVVAIARLQSRMCISARPSERHVLTIASMCITVMNCKGYNPFMAMELARASTGQACRSHWHGRSIIIQGISSASVL